MAEPLGLRIRRISHTIFDQSSYRILGFLVRRRLRLGSAIAVPASVNDHSEIVNQPIPPAINDRFPKIVFQTWKSRSVIPGNYRHWRQTFIDQNPEYQVVLWDDDDNRALIDRHYPWFKDVYEGYPKEIFRADAVRLFFLFHHGGLYADMDAECLRPVDDTVTAGDVVLGRMGKDANFEHSLPNAMMASKPYQLFWLFGIKMMMERAERAPTAKERGALGPETLTGPILLKDAYDAFTRLSEAEAWAAVDRVLNLLSEDQRRQVRYSKPVALPPSAWYPLAWTNQMHKRLCSELRTSREILSPDVGRSLFPDSTMVTYWSHSW